MNVEIEIYSFLKLEIAQPRIFLEQVRFCDRHRWVESQTFLNDPGEVFEFDRGCVLVLEVEYRGQVVLGHASRNFLPDPASLSSVLYQMDQGSGRRVSACIGCGDDGEDEVVCDSLGITFIHIGHDQEIQKACRLLLLIFRYGCVLLKL